MQSMPCVSPTVKIDRLASPSWPGDAVAAPASSASSSIEAARVRVDGAQGATISVCRASAKYSHEVPVQEALQAAVEVQLRAGAQEPVASVG